MGVAGSWLAISAMRVAARSVTVTVMDQIAICGWPAIHWHRLHAKDRKWVCEVKR
jgi:hypothetical protein